MRAPGVQPTEPVRMSPFNYDSDISSVSTAVRRRAVNCCDDGDDGIGVADSDYEKSCGLFYDTLRLNILHRLDAYRSDPV